MISLHSNSDYRYYMSYDIEVTSENGNKSFFSVSKEKSAVKQVPFYIVMQPIPTTLI